MQTEKYLLIHADDIGMCNSVNRATTKAMTEGIVTCGSVMVPCPWFPDIAAWYQSNPQADLGVHLTLTSEWKHYRWKPVASSHLVSSLVDSQGFLWHSNEDVIAHAEASEVEIEVRAQIERALQFGLRPTHVDSHMGTLFHSRDFFEIYVKVCQEFGLLPMLMEPREEVIAIGKQTGIDATAALAPLRQSGAAMLDRLITNWPGQSCEERKSSLHQVLSTIEPGVTELIVHLSDNDDEIQGITGNWARRYFEFLICTDDETRQYIEEQEITLIGYKEFAELAS